MIVAIPFGTCKERLTNNIVVNIDHQILFPCQPPGRYTNVYLNGLGPIRIVIVAETGLLRSALRSVLSREDDFEVTAEMAPGGDERALSEPRPHVVVIDMDMPDGQWSPIARRLSVDRAGSAIVVLTKDPTPRALRQALQAQVRGFASKQLPPDELVDLLRRVARGDRVIDMTTAVAALSTAKNPLTAREREVLRLAADGLPSKSISRRLFLTDGTVRNHLSSIMRKTGARNRFEAIRRARDAGWMGP
jgi:two-component system response regulator DesR